MRKIQLFVLLMVIVSFCSCSVVNEIYTIREPQPKIIGNKYDKFKGKSENEILLSMSSAPDKEISDGKGGKILVYENIKYITNSSSTQVSRGGYATVYGKPLNGSENLAVGASKTITKSDGRSVAEEQKKYVNFFIDEEGLCYEIKTNYGHLYGMTPGQYRNCKVRYLSPAGFWLWLIPPLGLVYTFCYLFMDGEILECGDVYEK